MTDETLLTYRLICYPLSVLCRLSSVVRLIMTTANSSTAAELVTAALLVIGDEILSGRTKDKNIGYIAEYLTAAGIWIGNVIVMAGVPTIMQAMLDEVAPRLKTGLRMLSETVRADAREGDIGTQLGEIAKANPEVAIGSYPFFDPQRGPNTNVVLRARDAKQLARAKRAVEDMLDRVRGAQSSGA